MVVASPYKLLENTAKHCLHCVHIGKDPATKSDEILEKCQRGGRSFSIQKFMLQILGTFTQGFLSVKSIKRRVISGFRACFFNNCIEKIQN